MTWSIVAFDKLQELHILFIIFFDISETSVPNNQHASGSVQPQSVSSASDQGEPINQHLALFDSVNGYYFLDFKNEGK
jgi:hypothetical protein